MQGLILAAGMGKRLKELTQNNTKCMVKVNGVTLIERVLHQLDNCSLSRIIIVVGYKSENLIEHISTLNIKTPICYVENNIYYKTNNIYSLSLAKKYLLEDDTLLLESDLIFEDNVLEAILGDPRDTLALVAKYESWMDGTCMVVGSDDSIRAFIPGKAITFKDMSDYYKTVNIYKFSRNFSENLYVPFLDAYSKALGNNEYYEQVLKVITMLDDPVIKAKKLDGQRWYEIDDIQDLDIASSIFESDPDIKLAKIQKRYGGYWRYPKLLDFCYLVNPYYPPDTLTEEIRLIFSTLLTQYPSGINVNNLLAAKNFSVSQKHIIVGNGAAELIKCLMEKLSGKTGFIKPTFEEYGNRYQEENSVVYVPENDGFRYSVDDIITFFDNKEIKNLILINPDNPSGNFIRMNDLCRLIKWCEERNIKIIIDESFIDFADESYTLINDELLVKYRNLIVIKSISKSFGIPGLRLGVLASSDNILMKQLSENISIWNINSFAEYYMQIAEKYKNDYIVSLDKIKKSRKLLMKMLSEIEGLCVMPSQANYILVKITNGITAAKLTQKLLINHSILIKDLTSKVYDKTQYIRIAVRNDTENKILINALKSEFSN